MNDERESSSKSPEPQVDARARIDSWVAERDRPDLKDYPAWDGIQWGANVVRAALAAYDEDHGHLVGDVGGGMRHSCMCMSKWPCPTKSRHEAALWKAISGEGV